MLFAKSQIPCFTLPECMCVNTVRVSPKIQFKIHVQNNFLSHKQKGISPITSSFLGCRSSTCKVGCTSHHPLTTGTLFLPLRTFRRQINCLRLQAELWPVMCSSLCLYSTSGSLHCLVICWKSFTWLITFSLSLGRSHGSRGSHSTKRT